MEIVERVHFNDCVISLIPESKIVKLTKVQSARVVAPGGGGWRKWGDALRAYRVSVMNKMDKFWGSNGQQGEYN